MLSAVSAATPPPGSFTFVPNLKKRPLSPLGCLNPPGEPSFNEILINTVREYPALYTNHRRPYDNVDRVVIWEEVASKIGRNVSAEFAKKRWLQLRDRYRKELKIAIAQNFTQPQKWNHFTLLKWLDPHLQGAVPVNGAEGPLDASYTISSGRLGSDPSSVLDLTSLGITQHTQQEDQQEAESDVLEDIKPAMSALQSVLAATEASVAAANAAAQQSEDVFGIGSEEPRSVSSVLDQMISSSSESSHPSASEVCSSKAALDALAECVQSVQQSNASGHRPSPISNAPLPLSDPIENRDFREIRDTTLSAAQPKVESVSRGLAAMDARKYSQSQATALARAYPYRMSPYLNTARMRCRAYPPKARSDPQPSMISASSASPAATHVGFPLQPSLANDMHWFNDEQMLFARIVGLRLKKMPAASRKIVRAKIMEVLDEQEVKEEEEAMESGASVAE